MLRTLQAQGRGPSDAERATLSGWRSWGAVPQIFDEDSGRANRLRGLLTDGEWRAARRTTINAHYTHPAIAGAIWQAATDLGFTSGGSVLEPGCGSGVFLGAAPVPLGFAAGVELDPVTAAITQALYPHAQIRAESFAESRFAEGSFDLAIGNVPFAKVTLHDPVHNPGRHTMHNHFIIKSLALTRPGGLVMLLTSRFTMDAENEAARRAMYERADLLAAARLPSGAHRRYAGTEAVTDLVVFRVRPSGQQPGDPDWLETARDPDLGPVNRFWQLHPGTVLGDQRIEHGMHGRPGLVVQPFEDLALLPARLGRTVTTVARTRDSAPAPASPSAAPSSAIPADPRPTVETSGPSPVRPEAPIPPSVSSSFDGHLVRTANGWAQTAGGQLVPASVPASCSTELAALVQLRDGVLQVLALESRTPQDTAELSQARAYLAERYRRYQAAYGPINRVSISTSSRRDKKGEPIVIRRYPPAIRVFRSDPHSATVRALEMYDDVTGVATPAAILSRRVLTPKVQPERADTPDDALAICMDTVGQIDLDRIGALLGIADRDETRRRLGTSVFDDPVSGLLVPAAEYLSGNVRAALAAARAAAVDDPRYAVNVEHLTEVIPPDLSSAEIVPNLGAIWIPADDIQDFLADTLGDRYVTVEHLGGANWKVRNGATASPAATVTWGTTRMGAHDIVERLMCQRKIVVYDKVLDAEGRETQVLNPVETEAATSKADALQARFSEWLWQDQGRVERLTRIYNDLFNAIVLRSYDAEGQRLTLPGLADDFVPHRHQRAAVARMIGEPSVGLFHAVGAGKTAEMVMGTTELRRLGLVTKPAVVVPNHMLEQFTREWIQLYPSANILAAASEDLRGDARRAFVARAATGDWDAVILTQGAFAAIPVSLAGQEAYLNTEVEIHRGQLERARLQDVSRQSLKQMETALCSLEEKIKRRLEHKTDPGLVWEQLGIDYLVIDELHLYKNLTITSNITDVARDGSARATDLDMKIGLLREAAGPRGRVITGATATPIANTMAEAYVMQKYLRPDLLHEVGLTDFDSWAATFGKVVSKVEMRPAGDGFRIKERFASFQNVPELLALWHVAADVKTSRDLALPVPDIARDSAGKRTPEVVVVPMTELQREFMQTIAERAKDVRDRVVTPDVDNMLKISSDGRAAGLDLRLLRADAGAPDPEELMREPNKLEIAAGRIHRIWERHREDTYPASPKPGGLQIVFCDLGTPNDERWNVYHALRDALVERGLDPARIRFIHDAKTDAAKGRLFAECRGGDVDVIIGSTEKMGVGTNIQLRAVALHHLDCPWRPADLEQREGRILRQGNHNPEVQILRYVSEGSFDAYMWQGVARKAAFIDQVMHGTLEVRSAEDIDNGEGEQFDFNTVTAVASGNPLLFERAEAAAELEKLTRLQTAHGRDQNNRRVAIRQAEHAITTLTELADRLRPAIAASTPTAGEAFCLRVDAIAYTERPAAGAAVRHHVEVHAASLGPMRESLELPGLARVGGHALDATLLRSRTGEVTLTVRVADLPESSFSLPLADISEGGLVTRCENLISALPALLTRTETRLETALVDRAEAAGGLGQPFPRAAELQAAQTRLSEIDAQLNPDAPAPNPGTLPEQPHPSQQAGHGQAHRVLGRDSSSVAR